MYTELHSSQKDLDCERIKFDFMLSRSYWFRKDNQNCYINLIHLREARFFLAFAIRRDCQMTCENFSTMAMASSNG